MDARDAVGKTLFRNGIRKRDIPEMVDEIAPLGDDYDAIVRYFKRHFWTEKDAQGLAHEIVDRMKDA